MRRQSGHVPWPYIEELLGLTLEAVGPDGGSVAIPTDFLALHAGDLTLEVLSQGLQYTLYIYPADA